MSDYLPYIYTILVIGGFSSMLNYLLQRRWKIEADKRHEDTEDSDEVLWYRKNIEDLQDQIYSLKNKGLTDD